MEDYIKTELQKYNITDAFIYELKNKYLNLKVENINDQYNYTLAKQGHQEVKSIRIEIEKKRKELKSSVLEYGRAVDSEAKRLTSEVNEIEEHLLEQRKIVEDEKERIRKEKQEAERIEAERIRQEELARIEKIRAENQAKIDEQNRIQEEERKKIEAEKRKLEEERNRIEDEKRAIEAEKKRIEDEKIEAERIRIEDEKDRIRIEKEKAERIEAERIRQEELDRIEKVRAENGKLDPIFTEYAEYLTEEEKELIDKPHWEEFIFHLTEFYNFLKSDILISKKYSELLKKYHGLFENLK